MKVILLHDIPGTGTANQVLNVSDGYARNFLFPRKLAVEASPSSVREIERRNEKIKAEENARHRDAEDLARSLKGKVIHLAAKSGEKGRLYGSVTGQEIADALMQQHGIQLDKRKIELAEPIRNIGESEAIVSLYAGVKVQMTIKVSAIQ